MVAVPVGGLDDQRVTVLTLDDGVDWSGFTDDSNIPVVAETEALDDKVPAATVLPHSKQINTSADGRLAGCR